MNRKDGWEVAIPSSCDIDFTEFLPFMVRGLAIELGWLIQIMLFASIGVIRFFIIGNWLYR